MMYFDKKSSKEMALQEVRKSLPSVIITEGADLTEHGFYKITDQPEPMIDPLKQKLIDSVSLQAFRGQLMAIRSYRIVNLDDDQVQSNLEKITTDHRRSVIQLISEAIDDIAVSHGYSSIDSAIVMQAEDAGYFSSLRDKVWTKYRQVIQQYDHTKNPEDIKTEVLDGII